MHQITALVDNSGHEFDTLNHTFFFNRHPNLSGKYSLSLGQLFETCSQHADLIAYNAGNSMPGNRFMAFSVSSQSNSCLNCALSYSFVRLRCFRRLGSALQTFRFPAFSDLGRDVVDLHFCPSYATHPTCHEMAGACS